MELKLLELKRAMDKEQSKRKDLAAGASGGFLWQNGSSGLLRGKFRTQQASAAGATAGILEGAATHHHGSGKVAGHTHAAAAAPASGQAPPPFKSPRQDAAPSPPPPGRHHSAQQRPPPTVEQPSISGSRIAVPPERAASSARAGSSSARRTADILAIHHDDTHEPVEGMGCGTDAGELADGHFNEGDSHRSFLDALNEWRRGNKAPEDSEAAPGPAAAQASTSRPAAHTPGVVMEVQTEGPASRPAAAAPRPSSARPISFFDKLVISENSRHAGEAAGGGGAGGAAGSSTTTSAARPPSAAAAAASAASRASATSGGSAPPSASPRASAAPSRLSEAEETPPATMPGPTAPAVAANDKLAMLSRLEELERARQVGSDDEDEDDGPQVAVLSSVAGRGLTKGTRLPDNIVVPESEYLA